MSVCVRFVSLFLCVIRCDVFMSIPGWWWCGWCWLLLHLIHHLNSMENPMETSPFANRELNKRDTADKTHERTNNMQQQQHLINNQSIFKLKYKEKRSFFWLAARWMQWNINGSGIAAQHNTTQRSTQSHHYNSYIVHWLMYICSASN